MKFCVGVVGNNLYRLDPNPYTFLPGSGLSKINVIIGFLPIS